jgi:sugar phosphate isomerase/epimerase
MPLLSLAHFTVIDADPIELIDAGAAGGFDAVGLRIVAPVAADKIVEVVGDAPLQRRIKQRLAATGIRILDIEAIWLVPDTDVAGLEAALDTGAELGAQNVLVCGFDPDRSRMAANFARLCEASNARGLRVMLEFLPYTHIRNLAEAHGFLTDVAPANAGLLIDALHLSRSGGGPADIAHYDPALFPYYHLCDAPAAPPDRDGLRAEARGGRLYPGEGGLWLSEFVAAFPMGTPAAIEAPTVRHASATPSERARLAGAACRRLFEQVEAASRPGLPLAGP